MPNTPLPKPHLKINLLYPQGLPQRLPALFLRWLLSYGRVILILVEVVVLATFAMRFSLDSQISDNKDLITRNTQPITVLASDEQAIRQTQFKLQFISSRLNPPIDFATAMDKFASQVPSGIRFTNLSIDNSVPQQPTFRITGNASTNTDLNYFVTLLRQNPTFSDVNLSNLGVDQDRITFSITGNLKPNLNL